MNIAPPANRIKSLMGDLFSWLANAEEHPLIASLPVESMAHEHQNEYYQAINLSTKKTDSAPFIEFILQMILNTIESSNSLGIPQSKIYLLCSKTR